MIIGLWHPGSGVGDQLFCYLAARITAERLGVNFAMVGKFKGDSFMTLDKVANNTVAYHIEMPAGKIVIDSDLFSLYEGKTCYDPEFNFIEDMTIVDGCRLQDERYWEGYLIAEWLEVEPLNVPDDVCIIGFRGGEYAMIDELFLPAEYWKKGIERMRSINPDMKFVAVTDDPPLARMCLPDFVEITHEIGMDWRQVRYAKYSIIANSAFYIIPRLLSGGVTLAPRYWARRNTKEWSMPQNYYPQFTYI